MRTGVMEDDQGSYNHEDENIGLLISMENDETGSNGRRDRHNLVTTRSTRKEVQRYRLDNERIMKAHEEMLHILNML
jgi:hypothetical protein